MKHPHSLSHSSCPCPHPNGATCQVGPKVWADLCIHAIVSWGWPMDDGQQELMAGCVNLWEGGAMGQAGLGVGSEGRVGSEKAGRAVPGHSSRQTDGHVDGFPAPSWPGQFCLPFGSFHQEGPLGQCPLHSSCLLCLPSTMEGSPVRPQTWFGMYSWKDKSLYEACRGVPSGPASLCHLQKHNHQVSSWVRTWPPLLVAPQFSSHRGSCQAAPAGLPLC